MKKLLVITVPGGTVVPPGTVVTVGLPDDTAVGGTILGTFEMLDALHSHKIEEASTGPPIPVTTP